MADLHPGVLLDVDGTLVDSNYLLALAWWRALVSLGHWHPMNAIHRLVGMGGDQLVERLVGHTLADADDRWRNEYDKLIDEVRPFPGARQLVENIHSSGLVVSLATSSPNDVLARAVDALGIGEVVDATTSADDVTKAKPEPEVFEVAMRKGRIDPSRALAIGDSIWDVRAARAAGIGCIGLESGGFSSHELREDGAIAIYRDAAELSRQLQTSPVALLLPTKSARCVDT